MHQILAINPGSTSTKIGLFADETCLLKETLRHSPSEIAPGLDREDQARFRRKALTGFLEERALPPENLDAVVVRGGLLKPLASGTYLVDDRVCEDLVSARYGWHASNLGAIIALPMTREYNIPLYTVDPVTVDEFHELARYSGLKGINRLSMSHALNMKAVARRAAADMGRRYEDINLVVAHLGSGISVSAHRRGKMIDVNNANEEGPFSMERTGTLPAPALARLCFEVGVSLESVLRLITSEGGIYSYLGTKDFAAVEEMVASGNEEARLVVEAMAYQVAKEIAAMAAALKGDLDRILITGGMANSKLFTGLVRERVSFIAPLALYPGEEELEALAAGALRVLRGEANALIY